MRELISIVTVEGRKKSAFHHKIKSFLAENYVGDEVRGNGLYSVANFEWKTGRHKSKNLYIIHDLRSDVLSLVAIEGKRGDFESFASTENILSFDIDQRDESVSFYDSKAMEDGIPSMKVYQNGIFLVKR
jgi:hypothetical protein